MSELLKLAERCEAVDRSLRGIIEGNDLSAQGKAIAIGMVMTLNLSIFQDCAAALRARQSLLPQENSRG